MKLEKFSVNVNNSTETIFTADRDYIAICDFEFNVYQNRGELVGKAEVYGKDGQLKYVLGEQSTKKSSPLTFQIPYLKLEEGDSIKVWGIPYMIYANENYGVGVNLYMPLLYFD